MRLTKLMGIAVVLVALAVALNALAFRTGAVTSTASFTVATTGNSAIAIEPAAPAGSGYTATFGNTASFVITDNMQPGSIYKFKNVFQVTHKANAATPVVVTATTVSLPPGVTVNVFEAGTATVLNKSLTTNLSSVMVDLEITLTNAVTTGGKTFDIVINGTQDAP